MFVLKNKQKMKKYLFSIVVVIALGFSACTPDEPTPPAVNPIVAKWEVTSVSYRMQDSISNGMLLDTSEIMEYAANELVLDFRANGDAISTTTEDGESESDTSYYTYTAPILKLYEEKGNMEDVQEFTVSFSGNNVMLKGKPMYESVDLGVGFPVTIKITTDVNAKKK